MSTDPVNRRDFITTGAAAAAALALPGTISAKAPALPTGRAGKPLVIASANGNRSRDAEGRTCVQLAYERIVAGADVLDALIDGVNIVELDPADTSVGYGGLPNAEGVVQLDAAVMDGKRRRAGAVAALEGVRTPSRVARAVADHTDHHLLCGDGARQFARRLGFTIEDDLNTPRSRELWLSWKRRVESEYWLDPDRRADAGLRAGLDMVREGLIDPEHFWGTVHCSGLGADGHVAGVTSTSGLAWKIPGRVGDSPILGAGLYLDNEVGAAGSTGRGEANLYQLSSFLIIELLRGGRSPKDAGMEALRRIRDHTHEAHLLDERGRPNFGISFYILDRRGHYAGVSMHPGYHFAVCDERGPREEDCDALLS